MEIEVVGTMMLHDGPAAVALGHQHLGGEMVLPVPTPHWPPPQFLRLSTLCGPELAEFDDIGMYELEGPVEGTYATYRWRSERR